jgi:PAS domain S-box-containing protein
MDPSPTTALLGLAAQVAADAIFCTDEAGRVTAWNAAATRLYGLPAAQARGMQVDVLHTDRTHAELRGAWRSALAGDRVERFDTWHRRADGSEVPVSVTIAPLVQDGQVVGTANSVTDITERTALAVQLQAAQHALEEQNDMLLRSNRDLEQFAYVASHDLSEPLRVISGFVTQLERRYADAFDERGTRYLRHIVEGTARMRALIDDLLEYSRFLRAGHEKGPVSLSVVVGSALTQLAATVESTGAQVEVGPLPAAYGDAGQLQSLVQNLLANALKFSPAGVPPRVAVSGATAGDDAVLVIDDAGIGIEPEYRDRVFRMFQRLHVREDYAGTGIGLAIVQQIVELHGGSVTIDDSPLGGARFRVTLPTGPTRGTPRGDVR